MIVCAFSSCYLDLQCRGIAGVCRGPREDPERRRRSLTAAPKDGVRSFKGIPFAQPPVGALRWREPMPVKNWSGPRNADQFGPRCMQRTSPGADYWFRSNGMSEDCLYLNVWTPAKSDKQRLPVMVYIFGGGFQNGDGSEPRYDGGNMAARGMVAVSVNYRTNIFGFFSHPELTKESPHHASGNYGLLDQVAALQWVARNIAAFGGDPKRVTIAGESAGSISVSALMASPAVAQPHRGSHRGERRHDFEPASAAARRSRAGRREVRDRRRRVHPGSAARADRGAGAGGRRQGHRRTVQHSPRRLFPFKELDRHVRSMVARADTMRSARAG